MIVPAGKNLKAKLIRQVLFMLAFYVVCLFVPAGTLTFWRGWLFLAVLFVPSLALTIYLHQHNRPLLERRLQRGEKIRAQKFIMLLWIILSASGMVLAGCDFRFGWTRALAGPFPWWPTVLALAVIAGQFVWSFRVFQANRFAASTIQVEIGQTLVDTGPYRVVRHPLYLGAVVSWLATPPALGSLVVAPVCGMVIAVIVLRLLNEEKTLRHELPGYAEYCQRTRYRLIPFVW